MSYSFCVAGGRAALAVALLIGLFGCKGGGGGGNVIGSTTTPPPAEAATPTGGTVSLATIQSGSASLATTDPVAPFNNLPAGVGAVTVQSPMVVNFVVTDTEGRVVTGLTADNVRFAFAKLIPGSAGVFGVQGSGESDQWVSYIYRTKSGTAIADGVQATYESGSAGTLTYNDAGYYSYTFATDVKNATRPDSEDVIWDPGATHRIAIQFEIRDDSGNRIIYNPHFDFTFDNGVSVPLTDTSRTHLVADESACNTCHNQLVAHGGRAEVEYCVMCHNPGSIDVEFGSPLDFKVMIHKIHKGRSLTTDYQIMGYGDVVHDWSDVGYPQDLRNCSKCHSVDNPATPQGDYWNQRPTQQACMSCHEDVDFNNHQGYDFVADDGTRDNSGCRGCHGGASTVSSVENVHWNQAQENSGNYRFNILDLAYDAGTRQATVTYSLINPNDDGMAYDPREGLTDCLADVAAGTKLASACRDLEGAPFSRFSLYIATLDLPGASAGVDDYTNHSTSIYAWQGTPNGDGSYTVVLQVPAEARGTARLLSSGQAQERRVTDVLAYRRALSSGVEITQGNAVANGVDWDWANRIRVPVQNAFSEFSVDDSPLNPRRVVVSDAKCNSCHGLLGTATGSNTVANAFHRGERSSVVACPVCHTPDQASSTLMSDEIVDGGVVEPVLPGTTTRMNQSYEFKNMIHGIHGGQVRSTPFMHSGDDLSGETHYPGRIADCSACHLDTSYNQSAGALGAAVTRDDDKTQRRVFSPFAASCMGCHDRESTRIHMSTMGVGGASTGDFTQAQWLSGEVFERCAECHGPGGGKDVKVVHGVR